MHTETIIKSAVATTPAFIIDQNAVIQAYENLQRLKQASACQVLYSIKALPLAEVMRWGLPYLDGFSVSSLFEARLANEVLQGRGSIHLTTPGMRIAEMPEISSLCQYISFNSLNQWQTLSGYMGQECSAGLRINPKRSYVDDSRYNPCRPYSKLGVPIQLLTESDLPQSLGGIHFHSNFGSTSYQPLVATMLSLQEHLGSHLQQLQWINLGGGYLYGEIVEQQDFIALVLQFQKELNVKIFIEPGNVLINRHAYLLSEVVDTFVSDGKQIAVLDTSVNHNPEVFEYQWQPVLHEHAASNEFAVTLVGSTCLAGDIFGEYRLSEPVKTGDRMLFKHVGAYSLVKANRFNGYNLPDVYVLQDGLLRQIMQYSYQQYREHWMTV